MADIVTPETARKTEEFTRTQIELVRNSLGIADNPILPDRTYIVFDAISGNNTLYLGTGGSSSYSINWGEGGLPTNYTDTGGAKSHNYTNAGRYLIIVEGTFNGLDYRSQGQSFKDQLISIIGGSNYPTTIVLQAFQNCTNLESAIFPSVITTASDVFDGCSKLKITYFPVLVTVGQQSFIDCIELEKISLPLAVFSFTGLFFGCLKLKEADLPSTTSISGDFNNCPELEKINIPLVTNIGANALKDCIKLKTLKLGPTVTISATGSFLNVVLTDVFVNGTEAQANTIVADIVTAGGLFATNSRLIFGSLNSIPIHVDSAGMVGFRINTPVDNQHIHEPSTSSVYTRYTNNGSGALNSNGAKVGMSGSLDLLIWNYQDTLISFLVNSITQMKISSSGINMGNIPTSSGGLISGDLWNDSGILKIIT